MSVKRKQYKPEFKAKVALAAIREDETTTQLSSRFGVHGTMVGGWKRTLVKGASSLFDRPSMNDGKKEMVATIDKLYRQID